MHFNHMFIFVNGRPVGYTDEIGQDQLEAAGFTRISKDFNEEVFGPTPAAGVRKAVAKSEGRGPQSGGPVPA